MRAVRAAVTIASMGRTPARYDGIADWCAEFTKDWDAELNALLPADIGGQRVLDLACGNGTASHLLARRGALVTGLDLSARMLDRARQIQAGEPVEIRYIHGDAAGTRWRDGTPYDGVLCHMALMAIEDLDGALSTAAAVLAPGGWFSFSVFHPCYPGGPEGSWSGLPSWPPEHGYAREGWWTTRGEGVRGRAGSHHRMLSTYLNAAIGAGLEFERFAGRGSSVPVTLTAAAGNRGGPGQGRGDNRAERPARRCHRRSSRSQGRCLRTNRGQVVIAERDRNAGPPSSRSPSLRGRLMY
jgi:SAM-dependent methyltransferase